jgi:hypothetical protein
VLPPGRRSSCGTQRAGRSAGAATANLPTGQARRAHLHEQVRAAARDRGGGVDRDVTNRVGLWFGPIPPDATVGDGRHELRFEFEPTGKADLAHGKGTPVRAQLYIDGKLAGQGDLPVTIPLDIGITEGLSCGRDEGSAVTNDYQAPFAFTGQLEKIVLDVSGERIEDKNAELRAVMAHQ